MSIAVHCKTEEEWEASVKKRGKGYPISWEQANSSYPGKAVAMNLEDECWSKLSFYKDEGYTIISAQEYLNEFKVGDRVEILQGSNVPNLLWVNPMNDYVGNMATIKSKSSDKSFVLEDIDWRWDTTWLKLANQTKTEETMSTSIQINSTVAKVFTDIPTAQMVTRHLGKEYEEGNHRAYLDLNRDKEAVLVEAQRLEDEAEVEA